MNTTTTHTPGPWYATPPAIAQNSFTGRDETIWGVGSRPSGSNIAVVLQRADAVLVTAAPDMLATLRAVAAFYANAKNLSADEDALLAAVRAAIARAEGRAP